MHAAWFDFVLPHALDVLVYWIENIDFMLFAVVVCILKDLMLFHQLWIIQWLWKRTFLWARWHCLPLVPRTTIALLLKLLTELMLPTMIFWNQRKDTVSQDKWVCVWAAPNCFLSKSIVLCEMQSSNLVFTTLYSTRQRTKWCLFVPGPSIHGSCLKLCILYVLIFIESNSNENYSTVILMPKT